MIYGYARASIDGLSVDAQVRRLRAAGAAQVFCETVSGAKTDWAQLRRVRGQLVTGDVPMVTRLDGLARLARDRLSTHAAIGDRKAGLHSLGDAWADTTTAHGRLILAVLGVKVGRQPKLTPYQRKEAIKRCDQGEPMREIARSYNVSHSTISRQTA